MALCLVSAFGFGCMAIFAKDAYRQHLGITALLSLRFALAALIFWTVAHARGISLPPRRTVLAGLALGAFGYAAQSGLYFGAVKRMDASTTSLLLYTYPATPAQEPGARQPHAALRETVEQFLHTQAAGLPGNASIAIGAIDPRLNLPACASPQAFFPAGSRAWGKTTVGIRCSAPANWTIYVSATVRVQGDYIVAAAPLAQGQTVGPNDVSKTKGDLTTLPSGVITDASQAIGRTLSISIPAGAALRQDTLRAQQAIQQGQTVRVMSSGPGFRVSSEARALNNASEGQVAQARTASGQVVSGVARMGGVIEVTY